MAAVLAHELGHTLRLNDSCATSSCNKHIMATNFDPSTVRQVKPDECAAANEHWETPEEEEMDDDGDEPCVPDVDPACSGSPLIFDVMRTGSIRTTGRRDARVAFDIDGDVTRESTQWVEGQGEDAFLWLDLDADDEVDGGRELFGDATILPDGSEAQHGFEALAVYDSDLNGVVEPDDAIWPHLRLWTDGDMDGRASPGEWRTLDEAGIASISLEFDERRIIDSGGNEHRFWGTYEQRAPSGRLRSHVVVDVFFRYWEQRRTERPGTRGR